MHCNAMQCNAIKCNANANTNLLLRESHLTRLSLDPTRTRMPYLLKSMAFPDTLVRDVSTSEIPASTLLLSVFSERKRGDKKGGVHRNCCGAAGIQQPTHTHTITSIGRQHRSCIHMRGVFIHPTIITSSAQRTQTRFRLLSFLGGWRRVIHAPRSTHPRQHMHSAQSQPDPHSSTTSK